MRLIDAEMINAIRAETLAGNLTWEKVEGPELFHAKNDRYEVSVGCYRNHPSEHDTLHIILHVFDLGCEAEEIPGYSDLGHCVSRLRQDIIDTIEK